MQHRDLGQRGQCVPLPVNVVSIPNDDNILELMIPNDNDNDNDILLTAHLRLLARRGMMRFLRPIRGLSGSAKRQRTTWLLWTIAAISCLMMMNDNDTNDTNDNDLLPGVETLVHVPRPAPVEHARAVIMITDQLGLLEH